MGDQDLHAELGALRDDLGKLRADIGSVAHALREAGGERAEQAKASASEVLTGFREELQRGLEELRERGRRSFAGVEEQIERNPFVSLLTAFAAGVILGKLLDRR